MTKYTDLALKAKNFLLYILFPRTCFGCGTDMPRRDGNLLCDNCRKDLRPIKGLICKRCGLPLKYGGAYCYDCRGNKAEKFKCSFIRSALHFTPAARSLIHAFKYEKYIHISKFFISVLHKTYLENPEYFEADCLVPVPIHKSRMKSRGFNQSFLLAEGLGKLIDVPCAELIIRTVKTKSQTALRRYERLENIKSAFKCPDVKAVKGKAIILIDDVCTTSATLEECSRVLKEAGAREVLALTALRE